MTEIFKPFFGLDQFDEDTTVILNYDLNRTKQEEKFLLKHLYYWIRPFIQLAFDEKLRYRLSTPIIILVLV